MKRCNDHSVQFVDGRNRDRLAASVYVLKMIYLR
eukprot:COSAG02_NODE_9679_length_2144_cov_1.030807_2_plen_34_part_00